MNSIIQTAKSLSQDIEKINKITIVPNMLEVICRTTGMGFAAIARVTTDRWIACSVRDEIQFGLQPGGELKIETTICNEIRDSQKAVVIDHVALDSNFSNHLTPKMYGFQSYISVPIMLKNGEFFGTLCAIDPHPRSLNNSKTLELFNLFTDLIAFHIHSQDLMQQSNDAIVQLSRQVTNVLDENRQYQFISNHNLQEPLRKMRTFSNMLIDASLKNDEAKTRELALKINGGAQRFSMMIKDISEFSDLSTDPLAFGQLNLTDIASDVCAQLHAPITAKQANVTIEPLPFFNGIAAQIERVFFHLLNNALKYSKPGVAPAIRIYSELINETQQKQLEVSDKGSYYAIRIEDNGIGIESSALQKIFDIFTTSTPQPSLENFGVGLAYCRKVIRLHNGLITAESEVGKGAIFSIIIPAA
jgi:signal transduction histidine kinase